MSGLTPSDLWTRYFALGGTADPEEVVEYLGDAGGLRDGQYNVLAHALNEFFMDFDMDHPVPYEPK